MLYQINCQVCGASLGTSENPRLVKNCPRCQLAINLMPPGPPPIPPPPPLYELPEDPRETQPEPEKRRTITVPKLTRRQRKMINGVLLGLGIGAGFAGMLLWNMSLRSKSRTDSPVAAETATTAKLEPFSATAKELHAQRLRTIAARVVENYEDVQGVKLRALNKNTVCKWELKPVASADPPISIFIVSSTQPYSESLCILVGKEWNRCAGGALPADAVREATELLISAAVIGTNDIKASGFLVTLPPEVMEEKIIRQREWGSDDEGNQQYTLQLIRRTADYFMGVRVVKSPGSCLIYVSFELQRRE